MKRFWPGWAARPAVWLPWRTIKSAAVQRPGWPGFVRLCDAFSLPLITFVDAAGFECLQGAAKLSHAYAEATTAKLTVVTGRAYGPVYIAAAGKSPAPTWCWPGPRR